MATRSASKINDFIQLATEAGSLAGINARFRPFTVGHGVQIVWVERRKDARPDFDRFLIEITSLADQDGLSLQVALSNNDMEVKNEFRRFGFRVVEDGYKLQMERPASSSIQMSELEFDESMSFRDYFYLIERQRKD